MNKNNHLRFQVSDDGDYYLEINDYKTSLRVLQYKNEINQEDYNVELGNIIGLSNRIQIATTMKIHNISLDQIEFVKDEKKTHPYNGMHKD